MHGEEATLQGVAQYYSTKIYYVRTKDMRRRVVRCMRHERHPSHHASHHFNVAWGAQAIARGVVAHAAIAAGRASGDGHESERTRA